MAHDKRQACIHAAMACYQTCLGTAMTHCLEMGGEHVAPAHFRLMMSCAQICQTSAHLMMIESEQAKALCVLCADVCKICADDCERIGDMDVCVTACRHCAETCLSILE
jgi:hypothetical protein